MREDIKEYCRVCKTCLANTKTTNRTFLHPHELAKAPFDVVGMDFMGPFNPPSTRNNKYIMVITDFFTKWPEVVALPDQTALTTADASLNLIVQRHGLPKAIVSDRGSNFTSSVFRHLCKSLNIDQRLTTAYNPASNGHTERFNRTLTTMLRKELEDGCNDNWENILGEVCFAYRTSIHSSTLESPFFMVYGRDANLPINNFLEVMTAPRFHHPTIFQRAREENKKARERQREQYNKRAIIQEYKVGDKVLLDIKVLPHGESKKFVSKFQGPYRITKIYENKTVDIADNSLIPKRVHFNRLRPFFEAMIWKDETCPPFQLTTRPPSPENNHSLETRQDESDDINDSHNGDCNTNQAVKLTEEYTTTHQQTEISPSNRANKSTKETNPPQHELSKPFDNQLIDQPPAYAVFKHDENDEKRQSSPNHHGKWQRGTMETYSLLRFEHVWGKGFCNFSEEEISEEFSKLSTTPPKDDLDREWDELYTSKGDPAAEEINAKVTPGKPYVEEERMNITFTTETTRCGPQPRFNNFTIATNGWELATYRECYWREKYVNFHGKHHVYRNGTWTKAEATLIQPERDWHTTFRYDDDNTYEYEPQANPAYCNNWSATHMNIVADIAAAMAEQNVNDNGGSYPIKTLILTPKEKADISNYVTWWETIKIILALTFQQITTKQVSYLPTIANVMKSIIS
ncbi:Retrovirus-related Pol polyprotein [Daphnia sinensis]|uniref:Retrovirus-related Pol polyprotein n=1 Tax=Daphnia sinensis TaxID=1820382 RepID=A0AAD5KL44_9CRUS|nr:Retrovirus-related Pol polyprotein [Daphnia sinensis]